MKVKLIALRQSLRPQDTALKQRMAPSLALLTVGALTPREYEVEVADENIGPLNLDDTPDLVGLTSNVDTSARCYDIASRYRRRGIPVVIGGIHASANPEEALHHCDAVCVGEAEGLWPAMIEDARRGTLAGIYRSDTSVDLAMVPEPRWELIERDAYLYTNIVVASRGCPFSCEFCYNSAEYARRPFRTRPVEHVVEEVTRLGTRHVMFIDDNFIGDPAWTRAFVRRIRPLGLKWNCAVSTTIGDHEDLVAEMVESGCQSVFIGFETISEDSLRSVKKRQNRVDEYARTADMLHERGVMINASIVLGFDHDGPDVFERTLAWLVETKMETMTAHILTPYPGTVLHRRLAEEGRIFDHEPMHYNTARAVFQPRLMSPQELEQGYHWLYDSFYAFPNVYARLPRLRRQWVSYLLFNFLYRKYGWVTARFAGGTMMGRIGRLARRLAYGL